MAAAGLTLFVLFLTWRVLRGGWLSLARRLDLHPPGQAIALGVLALGAAVYFYGPVMGLALIVSVAVHEYGHVAAYRVAGHHDATFRLIPLVGGVAISRTAPRTQLHDFYITAMGPGICLGLMAASWLLVMPAFGVSPVLGEFVSWVAIVSGALNFFNLLPIWPLDGGRIAYLVLCRLSPVLAHRVLLGMAALLLLAAIFGKSLILFAIALFSFSGLRDQGALSGRQHPLTPPQAVTALAVWLLMLAAFGIGGGAMLAGFLPF